MSSFSYSCSLFIGTGTSYVRPRPSTSSHRDRTASQFDSSFTWAQIHSHLGHLGLTKLAPNPLLPFPHSPLSHPRDTVLFLLGLTLRPFPIFFSLLFFSFLSLPFATDHVLCGGGVSVWCTISRPCPSGGVIRARPFCRFVYTRASGGVTKSPFFRCFVHPVSVFICPILPASPIHLSPSSPPAISDLLSVNFLQRSLTMLCLIFSYSDSKFIGGSCDFGGTFFVVSGARIGIDSGASVIFNGQPSARSE